MKHLTGKHCGPRDSRPPRPKRPKPGDLTLREAHNGRHGMGCGACRDALTNDPHTGQHELEMCAECRVAVGIPYDLD